MDQTQQIIQFEDELEKLVARFRMEYDLHYVSMIGILQIQAHVLACEALEDANGKN